VNVLVEAKSDWRLKRSHWSPLLSPLMLEIWQLIVSSAIFSVILTTVGTVWGLADVVLVRVGAAAAAAVVVLTVVAGTSDTCGTARCRRRPKCRWHACVSSGPTRGIRAVVVLCRVVVVPAVVAPLLLDVAVHKCVVLNVLIDLIHGFIGLAQSCAVDEINFLGALDNPTSFLCGHHLENMFVDPIDVSQAKDY